jgi:hypothetical protein
MMIDTLHLQLTAPFCIAMLGLFEEDPCLTYVANILAVVASKLRCETLLMNESRRDSGANGREI